jgi:hypothetical protein
MPADHSTTKWTKMRGPGAWIIVRGVARDNPPVERDFVNGGYGFAGQSVVTVILPTVNNGKTISLSCCARSHNLHESWGRPGRGK